MNVDELVDKLKSNRESHVEKYEEALRGWRDEMQSLIEEFEREASALSHENTIEEAVDRASELQMRLTEARRDKPESHKEDYDHCIDMLESSMDDEIELTKREFARLVRDEWNWKDSFNKTSSKYV